MQAKNTSVGLLSSAELKASSDRIGAMLRQLSWVLPSLVLALFVLAVGSFYEFRVKPVVAQRAVTLQREASDAMAAKVESTASQIDRIVLTMRDWVQAGVISLDDVQGLNKVMIPALVQRSLVSSIHLAHESGREVLLLKSPEGWRNRVTDVPTKGKQQRWLSWKDAQTSLADEWKEQNYDPRKRPWFTGVMGAPENVVFWTPPYVCNHPGAGYHGCHSLGRSGHGQADGHCI